MGDRRRFIKDVGWVGLGNVLRSVRSIIYLPLLTKQLSVLEYGMWVEIQVGVNILATAALLGLDSAVIRLLSGSGNVTKCRREYPGNLTLVLLGSGGLSIALYILAERLAPLVFAEGGTANLLQASCPLIFIVAAGSMNAAYFTASQRFKLLTLFRVLETCGELLAVAYALWRGGGLFGALIAAVGVRGIILLAQSAMIALEVDWNLPRGLSIVPYLKYGIPLVIGFSFYLIVDTGDRYIIGYFLGVEAVGVYSAGYSLAGFLMLLIAPLHYVLYPTVSGLWNAGVGDEARSYLEQAVKWCLYLLIPVAFALSALAAPLVVLFAKSSYSGAASLMPILSAAFVIFGLGVTVEHVLMLAQKTMWIAKLYIIVAVFNVAGNVLLVPRIGILGAAVTTLLSYLLFTGAIFTLSKKAMVIRIPLASILKPVAAAAAMSWVLLTLHPRSFMGLMIAVGVGGFVYLLGLVLLRELRMQDIGLFLRSLRQH